MIQTSTRLVECMSAACQKGKGFFQMQYYFYWSRLSLSLHACSISEVLKQHSYFLNQNSAKWNSKHLREYLIFLFSLGCLEANLYLLTDSTLTNQSTWKLPFTCMRLGTQFFKLIGKVTVFDGYGVPIHKVTAILVSIRIVSQQEYVKLYQNLCFYIVINWRSWN